MGISAVVLTKNSEKSLETTLKSLTWCNEIVIVDDNSTDGTIPIAKRFTHKIYHRALSDDFSSQRNFGLEKTESTIVNSEPRWVLFIDSDEVVSSYLHGEIKQKVESFSGVSGYFIKREDTIWGKKLLHGETGDIWLLRLAKKESGKWQGKVHEVWEIDGKKEKLKNPLQHFPHPHINDFLLHINYYSSLRAQELYKNNVEVNVIDIILYPKLKFLVNYFIKQGFRDGIPGFLVAVLMSFHSFLVRGKLWQLQNSH